MKTGTIILTSSIFAVSALAAKRDTSEISKCHFHGSTFHCIDDNGNEGTVEPAPSQSDAPSSYSGCHLHGNATFCLTSDGDEVQFKVDDDDDDDHHDHGHGHDHSSSASASGSTTLTSSLVAASASVSQTSGSISSTGAAAHMAVPALGALVIAALI